MDTDTLTTANGGKFTSSSASLSIANHVKARQSLIERAVTWLATESGWDRSKRCAICNGMLCGGLVFSSSAAPVSMTDLSGCLLCYDRRGFELTVILTDVSATAFLFCLLCVFNFMSYSDKLTGNTASPFRDCTPVGQSQTKCRVCVFFFIDREFEFYEFFSCLKFNEFY